MRRHIRRGRKGIVGIEAAIVLIAFVIISAAFAFMVINMGLFATQRSKDTISQGLREASSPLQVDGSIFVRVMENELSVNTSIIPLRAMGVKYVPVGMNETVVSLSIVYRGGSSVSYANIYYGVVDTDFDPTGKSFDQLAQAAINELPERTFIPGTGSLSFTLVNETSTNTVKITIDSTTYEWLATAGTTWGEINFTIRAPQTPASFKATLYYQDGTSLDSDETDTGTLTLTLPPGKWENGTYTIMITEANVTGDYTVTINVYDSDGKEVSEKNGQTATGTISVTPDVTSVLPAALLIIENSDGDEALDASEKGFLVILLGEENKADPRSIVTVEIRVERSAPLTVEFMVPESLTADSWMLVGG